MRILIVGAGAVGGYFGGRLLAAGRDVTFLVRPRRAQLLRDAGLVIRSSLGNLDIANPPTAVTGTLTAPFDLVILTCKAYDLDSAIDALAPAVGPDTRIIPLLNGLRHLDMLERRFGAAAVLGGLCFISANRDEAGHIRHFSEMKTITFGRRDRAVTADVKAIAEALAVPGLDANLSSDVMHDMWEKWVFIAAAACGTGLLRSRIGDIVTAGATDVVLSLFHECSAIAERHGFPPRSAVVERANRMFTAAGSAFTASMFRDIEAGAPIEADQIVGDLLARANGTAAPTLRVAFAHLKTYEARRERELTEALAAG